MEPGMEWVCYYLCFLGGLIVGIVVNCFCFCARHNDGR
jgi:hypothetical protein